MGDHLVPPTYIRRGGGGGYLWPQVYTLLHEWEIGKRLLGVSTAPDTFSIRRFYGKVTCVFILPYEGILCPPRVTEQLLVRGRTSAGQRSRPLRPSMCSGDEALMSVGCRLEESSGKTPYKRHIRPGELEIHAGQSLI